MTYVDRLSPRVLFSLDSNIALFWKALRNAKLLSATDDNEGSFIDLGTAHVFGLAHGRSYVIVRPCYSELYDLVMNGWSESAVGVLILGTPGIGQF